MITSVKLVNWKSHRDTELSFGDGTNILVGGMGSGKSSVLEAITYALFGTLPDVKARRIKLDDLIRSRPKPARSAEVEVDFVTPEGDEFVVKRVLERGAGTTFSELRKSTGEVLESASSTRVSELIGSSLKLDYDLFERAVYSEQNRLDLFLTLPLGKRRESIDELLGIDKLELARKSVGSLVKRVKDRADERGQTADQLKLDTALALLPVYEREAKELEVSIDETRTHFEQLRSRLDEIQPALRRLEEVEQKLAELERSLRELEGAKDTLHRRIEGIKAKLGLAIGISLGEIQRQVTDLERAYGDALARTNELGLKLTACSSKVREFETRGSMLRERFDKLSDEIARKRESEEVLGKLGQEELAKSVEELQLEFRSVSDELASSRSRARELRSSMEELAAAGPTCPVCESPLDEGKKSLLLEERGRQLEAEDEKIARLGARVGEIDKTLNQKLELQKRALVLAKEVEELPELESEHSQLAHRLLNLSEELEAERTLVGSLTAETENSRKQAEALRERLTDSKLTLQLRSDLDQLELELKRKLAEGLGLQRELWQVKRGYDESKAKELRRTHEELIRAFERTQAELAGEERLREEKQKLIDSVKEKLATIERCEIEAKHLRDAADGLTIIQTAFARTQTAMRREFIDGVNLTMSELWESVYPYGDYTDIKLAIEEERGDYVLQLRDRAGNWVPVEGVASGGERTDACLTLRIAFALALAPRLSWIVLDEPTHNLDSEGIQELAKVLRERLPEIVRQVLLITHEERLETAVSGYLYRFSRDKDTDEPTRVEQVTVPEVLVPEI